LRGILSESQGDISEEDSSNIILPIVKSNLDSASLRSLTDMSSSLEAESINEYTCSED
jgi:hypothetical protein